MKYMRKKTYLSFRFIASRPVRQIKQGDQTVSEVWLICSATRTGVGAAAQSAQNYLVLKRFRKNTVLCERWNFADSCVIARTNQSSARFFFTALHCLASQDSALIAMWSFSRGFYPNTNFHLHNSARCLPTIHEAITPHPNKPQRRLREVRSRIENRNDCVREHVARIPTFFQKI